VHCGTSIRPVGPTVGEHTHTEAARRKRTTTRPVVDWLSSPTGSMFRSAYRRGPAFAPKATSQGQALVAKAGPRR
jgi:hypothetical protein